MVLFKITQKQSVRDRLNTVSTTKQGKDKWESFPFLHFYITPKHKFTHTFPVNLNQQLCRAVTLASVIDCPPKFVCLWVPAGIPLESRESMRM